MATPTLTDAEQALLNVLRILDALDGHTPDERLWFELGRAQMTLRMALSGKLKTYPSIDLRDEVA